MRHENTVLNFVLNRVDKINNTYGHAGELEVAQRADGTSVVQFKQGTENTIDLLAKDGDPEAAGAMMIKSVLNYILQIHDKEEWPLSFVRAEYDAVLRMTEYHKVVAACKTS